MRFKMDPFRCGRYVQIDLLFRYDRYAAEWRDYMSQGDLRGLMRCDCPERRLGPVSGLPTTRPEYASGADRSHVLSTSGDCLGVESFPIPCLYP